MKKSLFYTIIFGINFCINSAAQTEIYNNLSLEIDKIKKNLSQIEKQIIQINFVTSLILNLALQKKDLSDEKKEQLKNKVIQLIEKSANLNAEKIRLQGQLKFKSAIRQLAA